LKSTQQLVILTGTARTIDLARTSEEELLNGPSVGVQKIG